MQRRIHCPAATRRGGQHRVSGFPHSRSGSLHTCRRHPDDENINQLRIVIASKASDDTAGASAWEVEENRLITETNIQLSDEYTFRVKADCQKRIYLLANCNGLEDTNGNLLNFTSTGAFLPDANGKAPVDSYVFGLGDKDGGYRYAAALEAGNGIPMTSVYEITIPPRTRRTKKTSQTAFTKACPKCCTWYAPPPSSPSHSAKPRNGPST